MMSITLNKKKSFRENNCKKISYKTYLYKSKSVLKDRKNKRRVEDVIKETEREKKKEKMD